MNNTRRDTTDVYRYKITTTGMTKASRWDPNPSPPEPYERIEYRGYYQTKQSWKPWRGSLQTVKLELQKLEAVIRVDELSGPEPALEWVTIRTIVLEDEGED